MKKLVLQVVLFLIAAVVGYYIGQYKDHKATVVKSTADGLVIQKENTSLDVATKECNFYIHPGNNNEPKSLNIDKLKIIDIDSYKVVGDKLFYSVGPVYGKPEIGIVDCVSGVKKTVVAAENKQGSYPYGSDYFRLKKVTKKITGNIYNIEYWYGADVDKIDLNKFEIDSNLKNVVFKNE